jgi:protein-S-isoprenylcysteine O-methyltransferase Ste14
MSADGADGSATPLTAAGARQRRVGSLLVALQLGLMGALAALAAPGWTAAHVPLAAWCLATLGLMVGVWAVTANRPGNFNIRPTPRSGGQLVQTGPYRWIRHPMYTALLLLGLACAVTSTLPAAWGAWLALASVLLAKARLEEQGLQLLHPAYAAYQQRTRRFVPGLW